MLVKEISNDLAQQYLEDGALLVDVRELNEVAEIAYDVKNILYIPLSEFEARFSEIPTDADVIMACRSGARSQRATEFLMHNGYSKAVNLLGGIIGWSAKGLPTK